MAFIVSQNNEFSVTVSFYDQHGNASTKPPQWAVSDRRVLKILATFGNTATFLPLQVTTAYVFAFADTIAGFIEVQVVAPTTAAVPLIVGPARPKAKPPVPSPMQRLWTRLKLWMYTAP